MGGAGPSMTWGGVNLTHSQEINKGVDWDTMLLFRVWTYLDIEITCKNSEPNLKNWARFWDLNFLEIEILSDLTHENHRNSLNF